MSLTTFISKPAGVRALSLLALWCAAVLLSACGGEEQNKVYEVGIYTESYMVADRYTGLKDGLKSLGYTEGKNLRFEELNVSKMTPEQRQSALKDFTAKNFSAYWTVNTDGAKTLQNLTKKPIIVVGDVNLVGIGLVQSVDRPGANISGVDHTLTGITVKQIGWLLKIKPDLRAMYVLYDPKARTQLAQLEAVRTEANRLNLSLVEKPANITNVREVLPQLKASEAQAVMLLDFGLLYQFSKDFKDVLVREKLILPGAETSNFEIGSLFTYSVTQSALGRQSAIHLDKVMHGADPATLPIGVPAKLELNLNQKLADQIGFKFPADVIAAADGIVK